MYLTEKLKHSRQFSKYHKYIVTTNGYRNNSQATQNLIKSGVSADVCFP